MRNKILLLIALVLAFYIGVQIASPYKDEVVDLGNFTEYYEDNPVVTGGWEIQSDNFYTFSKDYKIETKAEENKIVVEEKILPEKKTYVVQSGDTLLKIAGAYNIDLNVLMANNPGISSKNLKVGQKITVLTQNGIFYKVTKGDSLNKIAELFKVQVEDIKDINNMDSDTVVVGTELFIKDPNLTKFLASKTVIKKGVVKTTTTLGFIMPIKYTGISSPFGNRLHPVLKRYIYHSGVDLRARFIPLYAAKDGRVTFAGQMNGYGKIIIIQHGNGYETRYAHLDKIGVKKGDYVKRGELIGKTGQSGRVTGPHLHFELRTKGKAVNPMKFVPLK